MASQRVIPWLVAGGVGIVGGIYIWGPATQELSGKGAAPGPIEAGRSQAVKEDRHKDGTPTSASPHPVLASGGASPGSGQSSPTVAGTNASSKATYSADHDVKVRSTADAKNHDGTGGGGVGVAEMRERKMDGRGLPSPQGGDTKARPVATQSGYGEGEGIKKTGQEPGSSGPEKKTEGGGRKWWLGGGGR